MVVLIKYIIKKVVSAMKNVSLSMLSRSEPRGKGLYQFINTLPKQKNLIKTNYLDPEEWGNKPPLLIRQSGTRRKIKPFLAIGLQLKASTLIESLVASVIIIVVFTIASLTLNNVFKATIKNNTDSVQNRMNTIEYLFLNDKLVHPYQENFENWEIRLIKSKQNNTTLFILEAEKISNSEAKKNISRKLTYARSQ